MNQDISRPHLMGCPTSLWPTSYHSCKGHMKSPAPPLLPMEGGELPVKEQRASVVFSAAPASSAQPRACTAPPTTSHQISGRLWQPSLLPRCPPAWAPPILLLRSSVSRCQEGRSARSALCQPDSGRSQRAAGRAGPPGRAHPGRGRPSLPSLLSGLHLSTSEKIFRFQDTGPLLRVLGSLFLGGILAFGLGFSEFLLVSRTSSLTLSIAGIFKVQTGGDPSPVVEGSLLRVFLSRSSCPSSCTQGLQRRRRSASLGCQVPRPLLGPLASSLRPVGGVVIRHEELLLLKRTQRGGRAGMQSRVGLL